MPILEVEGKRVEVDESFLGLSQADQEKTVDEIASSIRSSSPQPAAAKTSNPVMGAIARTKELGGNLLQGIQRAGDYVEENVPGAKALGDLAEGEGFDPIGDTGAALNKGAEAIGYEPAENASWDGLKKRVSEGDLTGAAATGLRFIRDTAITSLPDMAAAVTPGGLPLYMASQTEGNLQARQANNGGKDLTPTDLIMSAGTAAAQTLLERFGAKGVIGSAAEAGGKGVGKAMAREGGTGALQNPVEYAGQTVGTDVGFDPAEAVDRAAEGLVGGAGSGGAIRTVQGTTAAAARAGYRAASGQASAEKGYKADPKQAQSDARVVAAAQHEMEMASNESDVEGPDAQSKSLKNVSTKLKRQIGSGADALRQLGVIDGPTHKYLVDPEISDVELAARHNRFLTEDAKQRIASAFADPEISEAYVNSVTDLNTAVGGSLYKARRGPLSGVGRVVGAAGGAIVGSKLGPLGTVAGAKGGSETGAYIGGKLDRALGMGQPPVFKRAKAMADYMKSKGETPGMAGDQLQAITERARNALGLSLGVEVDNNAIFSLQVAEQLKRRRQEADTKAKELRKREATLRKEHEALMKRTDAAMQRSGLTQASPAILPAQQSPQAGPMPTARDAGGPMPRDQRQPLPVLDPSVGPGQLRAANKGVMQMMQNLQAEAEKVSQAAAALEAEVASNDQKRQGLGGSLDERSPRTDGWHVRLLERLAKKMPGLGVTFQDLLAALEQEVSAGRMTANDVQVALKVAGARIGADPYKGADGKKVYDPTMLRVEDAAAKVAAIRQGKEWTAETAIRERQQGVEISAKEKAKEQGRLSVVRTEAARTEKKTLMEQRRAAKPAADPDKPKRAPRRKKPAAPVQAAASSVEDQVEVGRRTTAIRAEIATHDKAVARAVDKAPSPDLAELANQMRETPDFEAKQAIYETAKQAAQTRVQKDWVGRMLFPLTMYGPGGAQMRSEYAKKMGEIIDPDLVSRVKTKRQLREVG